MKSQPFKEELRDFLAFILHPTLKRQLPQQSPMPAWVADWMPALRPSRLLAWAAMLWLVNIFALGPLVLAVFEMSGAMHRLSVHNLPWIQALLWAPIVEEILFRFGLRRPLQALWMCPLLIIVLLNGVAWWSGFLLAFTVLLCWWTSQMSTGPGARSWAFLRYYRAVFGWVFHLVALVFAAIHIRNFVYVEIEWWMMVVLVLPQWVTGLVLGWMRVKRGIGSAILLHGLFNAGPLTVAWLALTLLGDA